MSNKREIKKELLANAAANGAITPAIIDYLGLAVDVFAATPLAGLGLSIFDFSKSPTKTVDIGGTEFEIPEIVDLLPNSSIYQKSGSRTSMDEVSNEVTASVGVQGKAGLFSAGLKGSFAASSKSSSYAYYTYLFEKISYVEMTLKTADPQYFSDDFANDLGALPETLTAENYTQFALFFEKWGLYYLSHSGLGGELDATNSVVNNSTTTTTSAELDMNAQYKGLFYSGSFESSVTASQSWSSFSSSSETQFYVQGGTPLTQGKILGINPLQPSEATVEAHNEWLQSLSTAPAPTEMYFRPVSILAGSKKQAMDQAARIYISAVSFGTEMRDASPQGGGCPIEWSGTTAVYVNEEYHPAESFENPGYQVLILDRKNPSTVVDNQYFSYEKENWESTYEQMYNNMYAYLEGLEGDPIVVFQAYQVYGGAFPTHNMQNYFTNVLGCGSALKRWANDVGSRNSCQGEITIVFYGTGVPGNGFDAGAGYYFGMWGASSRFSWYSNLNTATLVLNSSGKTNILSGGESA